MLSSTFNRRLIGAALLLGVHAGTPGSLRAQSDSALRANVWLGSAVAPLFPHGMFGDERERAARFMMNWFSFELSAAGEARLAPPATARHSYRVSNISNGAHIVRLERHGEQWFIVRTATTPAGRHWSDPARTITARDSAAVPASVVDSLESLLSHIDFWQLQSVDPEDFSARDGYEMLIEARTPERYHVIARWSPTPDRLVELFRIALFLRGTAYDHLGKSGPQ